MTQAVRLDIATRDHQLLAYTTLTADITTGKQPWATDPNAARQPVSGILISLPKAIVAAANVPGTWIEVGGADITPGNSPTVLEPGDSVLRPSPNAATIYIVASVAGLQVRGIIQ